MHNNINQFIQSLSVGTIAQNIGVYAIVLVLILVIAVQHKVLHERKR